MMEQPYNALRQESSDQLNSKKDEDSINEEA
jgi:hypothetical protein